MSNSSRLSPDDFSAAIEEKEHALEVGDLHKVAKFWEAELDALHSSDSLADGGVDTERQREERVRRDEEFRGALGERVVGLLEGCGFLKVRISSQSQDDPEDGWREVSYLVEAIDKEGRRYDMTIERGNRVAFGIEYTREFLVGMADQIAARLVMTRDEYLLRMTGRPTVEVGLA